MDLFLKYKTGKSIFGQLLKISVFLYYQQISKSETFYKWLIFSKWQQMDQKYLNCKGKRERESCQETEIFNRTLIADLQIYQFLTVQQKKSGQALYSHSWYFTSTFVVAIFFFYTVSAPWPLFFKLRCPPVCLDVCMLCHWIHSLRITNAPRTFI